LTKNIIVSHVYFPLAAVTNPQFAEHGLKISEQKRTEVNIKMIKITCYSLKLLSMIFW